MTVLNTPLMPTSELLRVWLACASSDATSDVDLAREVLAEIDRRLPAPRFVMGGYVYGVQEVQEAVES